MLLAKPTTMMLVSAEYGYKGRFSRLELNPPVEM